MFGILKCWFTPPIRDTNPILLVVAENECTQETIRRDFESLNCKVIPAFSGKSAWQSIKTGPLPDLIILDFIFSSDEDGPSLFRRFRLDKHLSSIPVIPIPISLTNELVTPGVKTLGVLPTRPTQLTKTPYELLFSVAQALNNANIRLPSAFRDKLHIINRLITDGTNPDSSK